MANGWSRPSLAPVYALVASFLLVLLLGAAFRSYSEPGPVSPGGSPPPPPTTTSAEPAGQPVVIVVKPGPMRAGQVPATGVENVIIWQQDSNNEIGVTQIRAGEWSYQPIDAKPFRICLKLKQGWSVTDPKVEPKNVNDSTSPLCTIDPVDGQKYFDFVLRSGR